MAFANVGQVDKLTQRKNLPQNGFPLAFYQKNPFFWPVSLQFKNLTLHRRDGFRGLIHLSAQYFSMVIKTQRLAAVCFKPERPRE